MKKIVICIIACLVLTGQVELFAKSDPSYLNPESRAYNQPKIGAICEECFENFMVSGYQLDNVENGTCPYCGHTQNIKQAANRYAYSMGKQDDHKKKRQR